MQLPSRLSAGLLLVQEEEPEDFENLTLPSMGSHRSLFSPESSKPLLTADEKLGVRLGSRAVSEPSISSRDEKELRRYAETTNVFNANACLSHMLVASPWNKQMVKRRLNQQKSLVDSLEYFSSATSEETEGGQSTGVCPGVDRATKVSEEDASTKMTTTQTVISIANILVGAGMLSLPFGFRASGWAAAAVLIAVIALMTFTAFLIGLALDEASNDHRMIAIRQESRDFAALAYLAFGSRGRQFLAVVFALELWFAILAFFVLIGINGSLVLGVSKTQAILIAGGVTFYLCYASLRVLGYLSIVSLFAICSAVVALIWNGISLPVADLQFGSYHGTFRWEGLLCTLGLCMFCFGGHPCLPGIYAGMQDRSKFKLACAGGFALAGLFYMIVSCIGYYFFGDFVDQSFTQNLGFDLEGKPIHGLQFLGVLAAAGFLIKLQGTIPLILAPVMSLLESILGMDLEDDIAWKKHGLRFFVVALSVLVAIVFQDAVNVICSISGCALNMSTSVIFPCAMSYRIVQDKGPLLRLTLLAVGAFGIVFGALGTCDAMRRVLAK